MSWFGNPFEARRKIARFIFRFPGAFALSWTPGRLSRLPTRDRKGIPGGRIRYRRSNISFATAISSICRVNMTGKKRALGFQKILGIRQPLNFSNPSARHKGSIGQFLRLPHLSL